MSISAVGPVGWGIHPRTNLYVKASYSNFGRGRIEFAAPGGTENLSRKDPHSVCTVADVRDACYVFDWVYSTIPGGYAWATGTSMAVPHVSGVAAQYIGAAGGKLNPNVVEALLKKFANRSKHKHPDPFYGFGVVDATAADKPY